jgi:hypothetical protein
VNERTAPRKHRRTIGILIAIVLFLLAAYPIAANAFLAFGGVEKAFSGTDTVAVHFRRAWSFWPGRVHVEGGRVTMKDRNVQFSLDLDTVDVNIDLLAFARRTFHVTRVRGSGVSFRFRHRIEHEAQDLPFVAALPPIPEFNDPPLREFGPPEAPLDEAHYNLWTVHIEDVDVTVRELWAQMMRYEGDAHVVGAFRLRPAKRLWVGPADLELRGGSLTTGAYDVLRDMRGKLTVKVDDFDVEPVHGMEPFRFITARLTLAAAIANLDVVNFLSEPSPSFDMQDGSGLIDADITVDHGVFTRDARFAYRTGHVGVDNAKLPFRLDGEIEVSASGPAAEPGGHLRLAIPHAALVVASSRHRAPELRQVEVELDTSNADVTKDFPLVRSEARFRDIVLPDLAWVGDLPFGRPHTWKIKQGRGHVGGVVALQQPSQAIDGSISAGFSGATVSTEAFQVRGTADVLATAHVSAARGVTVKGRVLSDELEIATEAAIASLLGRASVDADVAVSPRGTVIGDVRVESGEWIGDVGSSRFSGAALTGRARFEPTSITASATVGRVRTSALGSCPWAEAEEGTIAARIDTPEDGDARGNVLATLRGASIRWGEFDARAAQASILGRWDRTLFTGKLDASDLEMKNAGGAPRGWQADVASIAATTELAFGEKKTQGPAHLDIRNATGQVGKTKVRGDLVAHLTLTAPNEALRTADVSGRVQARNVALATKEHNIEGWWASFDLERARLDMRQDFNLRGKVKARFRDGLPALYILASEDEIPGFLPGLLPLEGLSLDLGVERFCRWTDVQILDARGGPFAAEGRLQIEPGETRGALLLRLAALKPISLGLNFVEDYSHAAPLVGGGWLETHMVPLTSAATEKHDQRCMPQPPKCP